MVYVCVQLYWQTNHSWKGLIKMFCIVFWICMQHVFLFCSLPFLSLTHTHTSTPSYMLLLLIDLIHSTTYWKPKVIVGTKVKDARCLPFYSDGWTLCWKNDSLWLPGACLANAFKLLIQDCLCCCQWCSTSYALLVYACNILHTLIFKQKRIYRVICVVCIIFLIIWCYIMT